jgi:hypothetical protein
MAESILQTFLDKQFIKSTDTENIAGLTKAVNALKKLLSAKKHLIIPYSLVAFDPQISDTDPVVLEVEKFIIRNWSTFKNSTSTEDKATTYVRVVILQALLELANDEVLGAIIWLTSRNVVSYYPLMKEKDSVSEMLVKIGTQVEINSRKYYRISKPVINELTDLSINLPSIKTNTVSQEALVANLKDAAVYSGWASQAGGGKNPSYTHTSSFEWSKFFSEKAGADLAKTINSIATTQDKSLLAIAETIEKGVNEYFTQINNFFGEIADAVGQNAEATNKRGNLLWWKQTLFSPSLNTSYRNQSEIISAMAMAYDVSSLIGYLYPESVNYLLREALRDVFGEAVDDPKTLEFWLNEAHKESNIGFTILNSLESTWEGRKTLSAVLANIMVHGKVYSLINETGIEDKQEIALSDLAVWILHDLQAKKISSLK